MKVLELIDLLLTLPGDTEVYVGDTHYNGDEDVTNYEPPMFYVDRYNDLYILSTGGICHREFLHAQKRFPSEYRKIEVEQ